MVKAAVVGDVVVVDEELTVRRGADGCVGDRATGAGVEVASEEGDDAIGRGGRGDRRGEGARRRTEGQPAVRRNDHLGLRGLIEGEVEAQRNGRAHLIVAERTTEAIEHGGAGRDEPVEVERVAALSTGAAGVADLAVAVVVARAGVARVAGRDADVGGIADAGDAVGGHVAGLAGAATEGAGAAAVGVAFGLVLDAVEAGDADAGGAVAAKAVGTDVAGDAVGAVAAAEAAAVHAGLVAVIDGVGAAGRGAEAVLADRVETDGGVGLGGDGIVDARGRKTNRASRILDALGAGDPATVRAVGAVDVDRVGGLGQHELEGRERAAEGVVIHAVVGDNELTVGRGARGRVGNRSGAARIEVAPPHRDEVVGRAGRGNGAPAEDRGGRCREGGPAVRGYVDVGEAVAEEVEAESKRDGAGIGLVGQGRAGGGRNFDRVRADRLGSEGNRRRGEVGGGIADLVQAGEVARADVARRAKAEAASALAGDAVGADGADFVADAGGAADATAVNVCLASANRAVRAGGRRADAALAEGAGAVGVVDAGDAVGEGSDALVNAEVAVVVETIGELRHVGDDATREGEGGARRLEDPVAGDGRLGRAGKAEIAVRPDAQTGGEAWRRSCTVEHRVCERRRKAVEPHVDICPGAVGVEGAKRNVGAQRRHRVVGSGAGTVARLALCYELKRVGGAAARDAVLHDAQHTELLLTRHQTEALNGLYGRIDGVDDKLGAVVVALEVCKSDLAAPQVRGPNRGRCRSIGCDNTAIGRCRDRRRLALQLGRARVTTYQGERY